MLKRGPTKVDSFLAKYDPAIASQVQDARARLAGRFPRGFELVYDNYNALVFGFSPTERASDVLVSVAAYPRWVTLFFLQGAGLPDPSGVLEGAGSRVRSVRLVPPSVLDTGPVKALLDIVVAGARKELAAAPVLTTVVKSVSSKQRPRKPSSSTTAAKGKRIGK